MDRSLLVGTFVDFGTSAFQAGPERAGVQLVHGKRASQLRSEIRRLCPRKPGVYGMVDGYGELIYVGKAKILRPRLLSYLRRGRSRRTARIANQACSIAWEVAPSEFAALLRELELIRRWRPRWNVQGQPLRRSHGYICLRRAPAAHAYLARRAPRTGHVFGPIPLGPRAAQAVRRLNDHFRLRDCPQPQDMIFAGERRLFGGNLTPGCLRHEIGTCLGPCAALCTRAGYDAQVEAARCFLGGHDTALLAALEQEMAQAAAGQAFERAAALRDRLGPLRWLHERLEKLRQIRRRDSFIYPVRGHERKVLWYVIRAGRPMEVLPAPTDAASRSTAAQRIEKVFRQDNHDANLEPYEHVDGLLLVAAWFRRHAGERRKVLLPEAALRLCKTV